MSFFLPYLVWIALVPAFIGAARPIKIFLKTLEREDRPTWERLGRPKFTIRGVKPSQGYIAYFQKREHLKSNNPILAEAGRQAQFRTTFCGSLILLIILYYMGHFYFLALHK